MTVALIVLAYLIGLPVYRALVRAEARDAAAARLASEVEAFLASRAAS